MGVDHDHVAHLAGAHVMHAHHPRGPEQGGLDGGHLDFIDRAVHQVVHGIPGKSPAHPGDHQADDQRGNRVKDGVASQAADDAHTHHQRRCRVRSGVPGIGHQHAGLDPLGDRQHVPEQQFLGKQCPARHPQRHDVNLRHGVGRLQF